MKHKGLNQLLCAAVVNTKFRETLLRSPAQAIASGYLEHSFSLTPEEKKLVIDIQAPQLEDFATQIYRWISGNGNGHNGYGLRHKVLGSEDPLSAQVCQWVSGNGSNGNGHNGHGTNGNGKNGNGYKKKALDALEPLVELYRAPALAEI
jgi:hypothetical protein